MEPLMKPQEAAARLNVSLRAIRQWLRDGRLKARKAGRLWRISDQDLERFLTESTERGKRPQ